MKNHFTSVLLLLSGITLLSGCGVVEGIFKAGMIWGIILVCGVVFGILYLFSRGRRK